MDFKTLIRDIPDFPKAGILFRDLTPLWGDAAGFRKAIDALATRYEGRDIQKIVGIESRGFIFGAALADRIGCGFVPARKPGKLPADTVAQSFELEYGTDSIEIHQDALKAGEKVLIVDDLLATGGTLEAAVKLVEKVGGKVEEICVFVELTGLNGVERLKGHAFHSVVQY